MARLLLKLFALLPGSQPSLASPPSRVLVIQIAGLGDAVMLTPFVRAIRAGLPRSEIDLLTSRRGLPLFEHNPHLDHVWGVDTLPALLSILPKLRCRKYDAAVSAYRIASDWGAVRMATLMWALGHTFKAGRSSGGRDVWLDRSVAETQDQELHEVEWAMRLLPLLGVEVPPCPWPLEVFPGEEHFRRACGITRVMEGKKMVCLHPASFRPTRRWPLARFLELGHRLCREADLGVVYTMGSSDPQEIMQAVRQAGFPLYVSDSPLSLAALYDSARCVVTNDTGAAHLSAARSVPVVVLMGPSERSRTRPWETRHSVLQKKVECSPCYYFDCPKETHCMDLIRVEEVHKSVLQCLRE